MAAKCLQAAWCSVSIICSNNNSCKYQIEKQFPSVYTQVIIICYCQIVCFLSFFVDTDTKNMHFTLEATSCGNWKYNNMWNSEFLEWRKYGQKYYVRYMGKMITVLDCKIKKIQSCNPEHDCQFHEEMEVLNFRWTDLWHVMHSQRHLINFFTRITLII